MGPNMGVASQWTWTSPHYRYCAWISPDYMSNLHHWEHQKWGSKVWIPPYNYCDKANWPSVCFHVWYRCECKYLPFQKVTQFAVGQWSYLLTWLWEPVSVISWFKKLVRGLSFGSLFFFLLKQIIILCSCSRSLELGTHKIDTPWTPDLKQSLFSKVIIH